MGQRNIHRLLQGSVGSVTQLTSTTTGVTLNSLSGQITTIAGTLAAAGEETFTVTNSCVNADSVVSVCMGSTSSAGLPTVLCTAVADGSFDITVANLHASDALNALLVINFIVLGGV
jgi:hypothetical protein